MQNIGTFYLIEDTPKFTRYMCEPVKLLPGSSPLDTPGYFVAGIVKGYLASAGFAAECASGCDAFLDAEQTTRRLAGVIERLVLASGDDMECCAAALSFRVVAHGCRDAPHCSPAHALRVQSMHKSQ